MAEQERLRVIAEIVGSETIVDIEDIGDVDAAWLASLVEHGVIEPVGEAEGPRRVSTLTLVRIAKAQRLQRDLTLDPAGLAVVLDLLDEIAHLRARVKALERSR